MKMVIEVDIKNNAEVLQLIVDTVPFMEGWAISGNITGNIGNKNKNNNWANYRNNTPRFLGFYLSNKTINWLKTDDKGDGQELDGGSVFRMSKILDYVYQQVKKVKP